MNQEATPHRRAEQAAAQISAFFSDILARLEPMRVDAEALFAAGAVKSTDLVRALETPTLTLLRDLPLIGGGFVATPGLLADRSHYLAWWQGEGQRLLGEPEAPGSGITFEYELHEWFAVPQQTARTHVAGPYVDYVCADELVLTATVPAMLGDQMIGVAGADLLLEVFEERTRSVMRTAGATLVNSNNRIVVSAAAPLGFGERVEMAAYEAAAPCVGGPMTVLV